MKSLLYHILGCLILLSALSAQAAPPAESKVSVYPDKVELNGPRSRQQLIVTRQQDKSFVDLTRDVQFQSQQPAVVQVDAQGVIKPLANGTATVTVIDGAQKINVPVQVKDFDRQALLDFERDIHPLFSRFGCNGGSCHGKQRGQGGFQLSMFAFDPEYDYNALVKESRG